MSDDVDPARVEAIFHDAVSLPPSDRTAFLEHACGGDAALFARVRSLLHGETSRAVWQRTSAVSALGAAQPPEATVVLAGRRGLDGPTTPDTIGPYRVTGLLGRGGFGVVYAAERAGGGARVAIKTVLAAAPPLVASIRREIRALTRLRHPGIVRIVDDGVEDGIPWYAMELLEGCDLRRWAGAGPLDPERVPALLTLARRVCEALAYLHGEGHVHRDLKPENVFVTSAEAAVLVDFGISACQPRRHGREMLEMGGEYMGTLAYMAPEQAAGELVDARADIYALGGILYEALTGVRPHAGTTPAEIAARLATAPVAPMSSVMPQVPRELDELVARMMARDRWQRIGHADVVAEALRRLGASDPPEPAPRPLSYLYRARLVGVDGPREVLSRAVLAGGAGRFVAVVGPSGSGKTRLATETAIAAIAGLTTPIACAAQPGASAALATLRPLFVAIADACLEDRDAAPRLLGPHAARLASIDPAFAPHVTAGAASMPADDPRATWDALADVLACYARTPLLLLLDDLQDADEATLGFLAFLLDSGRLAAMRLHIVALVRTDEPVAAVTALLQHRDVLRIELGPLDRAAVAALAADMLDLRPVPDAVVSSLLERSGGNPLFVSELLAEAVAEGRIARTPRGTWELVLPEDEDLSVTAVPQSLAELLTRRLRRLSPTAREACRALAVVGRETDAELLARLLDDRETLGTALAELHASRLVEEAGGRLRFGSSTAADVAYADVPDRLRVPLHVRAAEALEAARPDARGHLGAELARHWHAAGRSDRAWSLYLSAARRAFDRHAVAEAERCYRGCLATAPAGSTEAIDARRELAIGPLQARGKVEEARAEAAAALALARERGDRASAARALHDGGMLAWRTDPGAARADVQEALAEARTLGDRGLEGRALRSLATLAHGEGDLPGALSFLEEALPLLDAAAERAHAQIDMAVALLRLGRPAEAERLLLDLATEAEARRDLPSQARASMRLGLLRAEQGRLPEARQLYERALEDARRIGDRPLEALTLANLANVLHDSGDLAGTRAAMDRVIAIHRRRADRRSLAIALGNLATLHLETSDLAVAEQLLAEAAAISREIGDRRNLAFVTRHLGFVRAEQGRLAEAADLYAAALAGFAALDRRLEAAVLSDLGTLQLRQGRSDEASATFLRALESARALGESRIAGVALVGLAGAARLAGRHEEAEARGLEAEALLREAGARVTLLRCLVERGLTAAALGRDAASFLAQARALQAEAGIGDDTAIGRAIAELSVVADASR